MVRFSIQPPVSMSVEFSRLSWSSGGGKGDSLWVKGVLFSLLCRLGSLLSRTQFTLLFGGDDTVSTFVTLVF